MPAGQILWGSASSGLTYENALTVGYTLYNPVDDWTPRAGSEWVQAPSGVEDAWITGKDYTVKAEIRWVPDSPGANPSRAPLAGPNSWMQFIDYARGKNAFRFVPASSLPNFFIDGCYLVEPTSGLGSNNDLFQRTIPVTLRNPSIPWTQAAVRLVALEYAPGQPLVGTGLDATVGSRGTSAAYQSKAGLVTFAPSSVARDRHWDGPGVTHALRVESSATNGFRNSALSSAWTKVGLITVTTDAGTAPDGSTGATLLIGASSGQVAVWENGATIPASSLLFSGSVFFQMVSSSAVPLLVLRNTIDNANVATANFAWGANSTLGVTALGTSSTGGVMPYGNGWYRAWCSVVPATSQTLGFMVFPDSNGTSGQVMAWGPQQEAQPRPTSIIPTTAAATATRNADALNWTLPTGFQAPQAMWVYTKFVERGAIYSLATPLALSIATSALAGPAVELFASSSNCYRFTVKSSSGGVNNAIMSTASAIPLYGDTVELLGTISSSGGVTLKQSINGAADVASAAPTWGVALPSSWSATNVWPGQIGANAHFDFLAIKMGPGSLSSIAAARSA